MRKDLISIIVPCYNEEESLPIFYKEINKISKEMKNVNFEFLFISDGSRDKTLEILKKYAKKDKRVRFISFSRNFGKEAGMYAGLENAKGDYVAVMDADMQDPPVMVKEMYSIIQKEDYDCVALYTKDHKDYSFVRKFFTKCWYKLIGIISSTPQVPGARDFRLMKRKMVDAIVSMNEYNRYSKGIFSFVGFNTKWIDYTAPDRVAGVTKWSFSKLFVYAIEGIVSFTLAPLYLIVKLGVGLMVLDVLATLVLAILQMCNVYVFYSWVILLLVMVFLVSLVLCCMGISAIYQAKTYSEVKNRPIYITKETNVKK